MYHSQFFVETIQSCTSLFQSNQGNYVYIWSLHFWPNQPGHHTQKGGTYLYGYLREYPPIGDVPIDQSIQNLPEVMMYRGYFDMHTTAESQ